MHKRGTWAAGSGLAQRSFVALTTGRTVSLLGNGLAGIAVTFAVLDLTGSATDLGLVLASRSAAFVVLLLLGGVISDRVPQQSVLVVSSVGCALTQALAATLVLRGHATVGALAAVEGVNGAAAAFVFPASASLLPLTVTPDRLQQANVVFRMFSTAAMVGGVSAGGILVAGAGPGYALAGDAVGYGVAALAFAAIPVATATASGIVAQQHANVLVDLREGWSEFRSRTWLWTVVTGFGVINAVHAAGWYTLGPVIADATFGRRTWGFVLAAEVVGMFVSGALLLRVRFRRPLFVGMIGVLAWSPLMLVLAAEPAALLLVAASFVAGAAIEVFGLGWDLSMQQHVPSHLLSRVYAYDGLGSVVAIPVGQVLAGPAAARLGLREAVVLCAVVLMVVGLATSLVPAVRRLERTDPTTA